VASYRAGSRDGDLQAAGVDRAAVPPEVDLDMVRDAAYQMASVAVVQRESADRAKDLIRRARNSGQRTVTIWSEGERELWPPYRRVEMSLSTGRAVSVVTETDPDSLQPRFALEALALDPETGELADDEPLVPRREFSDPRAFQAAAHELRRALLST
jgi:hypothetical protein